MSKIVQVNNLPNNLESYDNEMVERIVKTLEEILRGYEIVDKEKIHKINCSVFFNSEIKHSKYSIENKIFIGFNNFPQKISTQQDIKDSVFRGKLQAELKVFTKFTTDKINKISLLINYNKEFDEIAIKSNNQNSTKNNEEGLIDFIPIKPRYKINNIILNEDLLGEVNKTLSILEQRHILYEEWGFDEIESKPKAILNFFGPPGTGKTMMAHCIADKFNINILSMNYADIESKFVGDAPKNLVRAFETAEKENSLLFFDEADSFLGKRIGNVSSSSDQAVNSLRSQMLILLENFTGIVIFATNLITNYDRAFESRIFKHLKFDLPNQQNRKLIIKNTIPSKVPFESNYLSDETIEILSNLSDGLSGREIKNAILDSLATALIAKRKFVKDSDFIDSFEKMKINMQNLKNEYQGTKGSLESKKLLEDKIKNSLQNNDIDNKNETTLKTIALIAYKAATIDGEIKEREKDAIKVFCKYSDITFDYPIKVNSLLSIKELSNELKTNEDKLSALDIISYVLSSDGEYSELEKLFIDDFCNNININKNKVEEIHSYILGLSNSRNSWEKERLNLFE